MTGHEWPARIAKIRSLLVPIARSQKGPTVINSFDPFRSIVFGAHPFGASRPTSKIRDWRFKTSVDTVNCNYWEAWEEDSKSPEKYHLSRSYLTLYSLEAGKETEVLALHCDPLETSQVKS